MKKIALVSLALGLIPVALFAESLCSGVKTRPATSSKKDYMGIQGMAGRHCPGAELFWVQGESGFELCYARGKKPASSVAGALAVFSPNCKYFWTTGGYSAGTIHLFSISGKSLGLKKGENPAWSSDSENILYFQKEGELSAWDVKTKKSRKVMTVADYVSCRAPGERGSFTPITVVSETEAQWVYPTSATPTEGTTHPAKQITFHPVTGEITATSEGAVTCSH